MDVGVGEGKGEVVGVGVGEIVGVGVGEIVEDGVDVGVGRIGVSEGGEKQYNKEKTRIMMPTVTNKTAHTFNFLLVSLMELFFFCSGNFVSSLLFCV